jgi:hypothetical protein
MREALGQSRPGGGAAATNAGDRARIEALVELGIDSPLKLDIVAAVDQRAPDRGRADALAAACGLSSRDVIPTLEELARAGLFECSRFYNIAEYEFRPPEDVRARLRTLLGATPDETRRLRRALLAREARISLS